ncbi:MAG: glycosyltransferase [Deltaproteobacteria bacterium]|nr:glycosyltransferase [Deltaproteobacteria bacterium]
MRILHITGGLGNLSGTTHILGALSEEQAKAGHQVSAWFCERPNEEPVVPNPSLVTTRCFPLTLPFANPGVSFPFGRAIQEGVRGFDVIHIHAVWNFPTITTMRAAHRAGVPYVVAPQGSLDPWALSFHKWRKSLYTRYVEKPYFDRAAAIQALTAKEADQVRAFGVPARIAIIPNGIRFAEFDREADVAGFRAKHGLGERKFVLYLSRLHPKKGLDLLAQSFASVIKHHPDLVLVIAGGDYGTGFEAAVRGFVKAAHIEDKTIFAGAVRGDEKRAAFKAAELFVLPSRSEGLPMAALEAMASGTPVVVSEHCNVPEVAEARAGIVISLDVDDLARGISRLLSDEQERKDCARAARDLAARKFEWSAIAEQTLKLYAELTSQRP